MLVIPPSFWPTFFLIEALLGHLPSETYLADIIAYLLLILHIMT